MSLFGPFGGADDLDEFMYWARLVYDPVADQGAH